MTCVLFAMLCVWCTSANKLAAACLVAFTVPHFRHCFLVTGRKIQKWEEPLVRLVKWQISYRRRNAPPRSAPPWRHGLTGAWATSLSRFLVHTQYETISGGTPLNGWSALRTGRYLQNTQQTQEKTSMPSAGFEPTLPAIKRLQTCALDRAANGMGRCKFTSRKLLSFLGLFMP
jgi:hypothetical protein